MTIKRMARYYISTLKTYMAKENVSDDFRNRTLSRQEEGPEGFCGVHEIF